MAKKFSWENFPISFLKAVIYGPKTRKSLQPAMEYDDVEYLIPYMDEICPYPDELFVKKYREEIQDYFLNGTNHLIQVVKKLERYNYGGVTLGDADNDDMLFQLRQKRFTETLCDVYLTELRLTGKQLEEDDNSLFRGPKTLDLLSAETDPISLFPYQERAVNTMRHYFQEEQGRAGILSMPTGSGKTRTSVLYLLRDMISQGYQVIWLAHRSMLIDQAAEQFYRFAPVIKERNERMKEFRMVCISGKHATVKALQREDNLIISSVQSLCNNTVYLPNILAENVMIVVDEAHHTLAPSYRRIIKAVRDVRPDARLLGLTATPVRLTDNATKSLMQIFDNKIIYTVTMSELIANGTLSTPNYLLRQTNMDIEAIIDIDEGKYIRKWGELPESLMKKIAKTNERNELIVNEYIQHKEEYGKTIVFALNAVHCLALDDAFKAKGIRSGFVYTRNPDNQHVIERFRHNEGEDGIDVLININILTEGSDIPDIQTVFLTRPTSSDVLLMQMVGRGMRGAGCGGTETVNIVDFCDKWDSITNWMNPKFLFDDGTAQIIEPVPRHSEEGSLIPFDMIRDIVKGIKYNGVYVRAQNATLPVGWYDVNDEDGNDVKVLVFENQQDGYQKFEADKEIYISDMEIGAETVITRYFRTFGMIPADNEIEYILSYVRQEKEFPVLQRFEVRDRIDPFAIAGRIESENLHYNDIVGLIQDTYRENKGVIQSLYGSQEYYTRRVNECLLFPKGIVPVGTRIEEVEKAFYELSEEPLDKSLDQLLDEVMVEQREKLPEDFIRPVIYWTDKAYGSYFGMFYHDRNMIHINCLLNSQSVPEEVVKYVIYHECLHQEFYGHPAEFRQKEYLYPDFQKWENFLDYQLKDFNRSEGM